VNTKAGIDAIISFGSNVLGTDYTGAWNSDGDELIVKVVDSAGNAISIGQNISIKESGNLTFDNANVASTSNIVLSGDFYTVGASSLVGWWKFDEGSGSTAADSSGQSNDGVITGAVWVAGKSGNALDFNDTGAEVVTIPDSSSLDLTTQLTFSAWVNMNTATSYPMIMTKGVYQFALNAETGNLSVVLDTVKTGFGDDSNNPVPTSAWALVTATWDGETLIYYVNGVADGSYNVTGTMGQDNSSVLIGRRSDAYYFDGLIDDVRIYNRALSAVEVNVIFTKAQ